MPVDDKHLMIVSPDEGGMGRAVYYASLLGVNMGNLLPQKGLFDHSQRRSSDRFRGISSVMILPVRTSSFRWHDRIGQTIMDAAPSLRSAAPFRKGIICATFGLSPMDWMKSMPLMRRGFSINIIQRKTRFLYQMNVFISNVNECRTWVHTSHWSLTP